MNQEMGQLIQTPPFKWESKQPVTIELEPQSGEVSCRTRVDIPIPEVGEKIIVKSGSREYSVERVKQVEGV